MKKTLHLHFFKSWRSCFKNKMKSRFSYIFFFFIHYLNFKGRLLKNNYCILCILKTSYQNIMINDLHKLTNFPRKVILYGCGSSVLSFVFNSKIVIKLFLPIFCTILIGEFSNGMHVLCIQAKMADWVWLYGMIMDIIVLFSCIQLLSHRYL